MPDEVYLRKENVQWSQKSSRILQIWSRRMLAIAIALSWIWPLVFAIPMAHPYVYSYLDPRTMRPLFVNKDVSVNNRFKHLQFALQVTKFYFSISPITQYLFIPPLVIMYIAMIFFVRTQQ